MLYGKINYVKAGLKCGINQETCYKGNDIQLKNI